jgi:hypothetical protein
MDANTGVPLKNRIDKREEFVGRIAIAERRKREDGPYRGVYIGPALRMPEDSLDIARSTVVPLPPKGGVKRRMRPS